MSKPTFVFCRDAWVIPAFFSATRSRLEALGVPSACPAHPSIDTRGRCLFEEGRDVIIVALSYGGIVASSAVEGLTKSARENEGKSGNVIKVIFLSAFALDKGQSILGILGGHYLPWMKVEHDYVLADGAGDIGCQDIPMESQEKWNSLTLHTSQAVFSGESTYEPWKEIPYAYIVCEEDRALPPPMQELFASKMGGPENTYRLPSSHSPFLSMPDQLAKTLQNIVM
ncbi:hypothetical protein N7532_001650 [Penicillium argentinense]|uniref:AB hydrolase-1 domain-containing protein n=1 Tax=Penicillium argentinense TaxID=1131581 RepID=A0A9W9G2W3_9EURO|nr:uncharacterized protein N7532_001650 [Penicillium argentinense]KAJ5111115.1 hypothetical protein N7532_001650 [Penicillium argentinense]